MIFFIPVMAVVYILLKETVNARIERQRAAAAAADEPPQSPETEADEDET